MNYRWIANKIWWVDKWWNRTVSEKSTLPRFYFSPHPSFIETNRLVYWLSMVIKVDLATYAAQIGQNMVALDRMAHILWWTRITVNIELRFNALTYHVKIFFSHRINMWHVFSYYFFSFRHQKKMNNLWYVLWVVTNGSVEMYSSW